VTDGAKPAARLLVVNHADAVRVVPLPEGGRVTLGRADDCFVQIADDTLLSRRHVTLHLGPEVEVEDLNSQNGTRILVGRAAGDGNEPTASLPVRLEPRRPTPLPVGARVQVGSTVLSLQQAPAEGEAIVGDDLVVADPRLRHLHALLERVAARAICVLLLGETGVGKEVFAQRLHALSPRAAGPFIGINCGALSEGLLESELFGHERGAFTGAHAAKPGLFEAASGGTAFLDEVGELSAALQVKLLRVLEERTVTRVGAVRPRPIDVRVVSATNRNLDREVSAGRFRNDLYYRLNGISMVIPPLRERPVEIAPLASLWARRFGESEGRAPVPALSDGALQKLRAYDWPGNVRELRNVIERALVLCDGPVLGPEHISFAPTVLSDDVPPRAAAGARPPEAPSTTPPAEAPAATLPPPPAGPGAPAEAAPAHGEIASPEALRSRADAIERERLSEALRACNGNQTRAAALLGISRRALIVRLERFNLPRPKKRPERA
jgi:two-component system, NtrC family, response regulator AtoC